MQKITDKARELVMPLAQSMGLDVVDIEYVRENTEWSLRVYIDKRGGVRIDDCEELSKAFSKVLDEVDIINRAYNLVVSSPGLDRPLRTEADFRRHEGELLDIYMLPGKILTSIREEPAEQNTDEENLKKSDNVKTGKRDSLKTGVRDSLKTGVRDSLKTGVRDSLKTGNRDIVSGTLVKFIDNRLYLADERGNEFSLAWYDVKIAKRAIRFK